jgi:exodeoxyribonuclease-3
MKVISWNVNGLRSVFKKGFMEWLKKQDADVICLQETRSLRNQVQRELGEITSAGWFVHLAAAERKGYSGVAILSRLDPCNLWTELDSQELDCEGRLQVARFGDLTIANGYFPNGSGKNRDHSRIPYKFRFYEALFDRLESHRAAGEKILVVGDYNTAPAPIDLARPKSNRKTSGFTFEECEHLEAIMKRGWSDVFRLQHPEEEGHYTWWSNRPGVRERNVGWRIDLTLASPGLLPHIDTAFIHPDVMGSDHCPIGVSITNAE